LAGGSPVPVSALLAAAGLAVGGGGRLAALLMLLMGAGVESVMLVMSVAGVAAAVILAAAGLVGLVELRGAWRAAGALLLLGSLLSVAVSSVSVASILWGPWEAGFAKRLAAFMADVARMSSVVLALGLAGLSLGVLGVTLRGVVGALLAVSLLLAPEVAGLLASGPRFVAVYLALTGGLSVALAAVFMSVLARRGGRGA